MQQIELDRSELHRLAFLQNGAGGWIEFDFAHAQDFRRLPGSRSFRGTCPTQDRPDAGHQFPRIERLGKIVVSADFESDDTVNVFAARGEQEHRNPGLVAQPPQHFESVQAREHYIQDHQQKVSVERLLQTAISVRGGFDLKALGRQILAHQAAQFDVVIDNENAIHGVYCTSTAADGAPR